MIAGQAEPADDPLDEAFVPIARRSLMEQARWWAVGRKRKTRQERAVLSRSEEGRMTQRSLRVPRVWNEDV